MSRNENGKTQAPPEKSNFTRRCSLLSRYLKEKGSFGNINLGLLRKPDSNLGLPGKSDPPGNKNEEIKALDLFQKVSKGEPSTSSGGKVKDATNHLTLSESEEKGSSQLTIFFGGQVIVYNEFPAEKAKEIVEVAKQAKSVAETNIQIQTNVENNDKSKSNMVLPDLNEPTNSTDISQQQPNNQVVERIARRASLHRFFAKRKDRAVARAPYQVNQNAGHNQYPPKPEIVTGQQPLELGQSSSQRPDNTNVAHPKSNGDKNISMEIEEEGQCSKDLELRL